MKIEAQWFLFVGALFAAIAFLHKWISSKPLSTSILYLLAGIAVGPYGLDLLSLAIAEDSKSIEITAEIVVIISLFAAGLKLRRDLLHTDWRLAYRLASLSMLTTVALVAIFAVYFFKLDWAVALLLGGILAPTDPVLASSVQVNDEKDRDRLKFALTGEAGLNDGAAFPVVMLGLALLHKGHAAGVFLDWVLVDLLWATIAGLACGTIVGWIFSKFLERADRSRHRDEYLEDYFCVGVIGFSYGLAIALGAYGFLSVFAAALVFGRLEGRSAERDLSPAHIRFSTQLERIGEAIAVLMIGALLPLKNLNYLILCFGIAIFLIIRPAAVVLSIPRERLSSWETLLMSWFGIRGIGSIYYLFFAVNQSLPAATAKSLCEIVLFVVAISIFLHGITANPMIRWHENRKI